MSRTKPPAEPPKWGWPPTDQQLRFWSEFMSPNRLEWWPDPQPRPNAPRKARKAAG